MNTPLTLSFRQKTRLLTGALLVAWAIAAFGWVWFARDLDFQIGPWQINFWMAAQGSLLVFLLLTVVNAWCINRWAKDREDEAHPQDTPPPSAP